MQSNRRNNGLNAASPVNGKTSSGRSAKTLRWYMDDVLLGDEINNKDKRASNQS